MDTIVVATDFSIPAYNAADFAVGLAPSLSAKHIILYNSYDEAPMVADVLIDEKKDHSKLHTRSQISLSEQAEHLEKRLKEGLTLETLANGKPLLKGVDRLASNRGAKLLVAGVTGKGRLEKFIIGSNTAELVKNSPIPLLLIPNGIKFRPIKKVVFACDLKKVAQSTPTNKIKEIIRLLGAQLVLLHVAEPDERFNVKLVTEQHKLHELFDEIKPEYHYTNDTDPEQGIIKFVKEVDADLVITVPKSYGLFTGLFHKSVTRALAQHTQIPLLILHYSDKK